MKPCLDECGDKFVRPYEFLLLLLLMVTLGIVHRGRRGVRTLSVRAGGAVELLRGLRGVRSGKRETNSYRSRHVGVPISGTGIC